MGLASSILQLINNVWGLTSKPLEQICNLEDNVVSLREATGTLKARSNDVLAKVEREERGGGVQRKAEVDDWLVRVKIFVDQVDQILREAGERDQIECLSGFLPPNCCSSYKLGKRVDQLLDKARDLQQEGEVDVVTSPLPPPSVLEMPMDRTVGLGIPNEVWKWVLDKEQVGKIGLYGTGGVGKTTLMRNIEKKLSRANNRFDFVIWVTVSKSVNKDRIQDDIKRKLGIEDEHWEKRPQDERIHRLCQALTRNKFVLLLDDLWEWLDLLEFGVSLPVLQDGSKVVFTTRQKDVCLQMVAGEISEAIFEVPYLTSEEAQELFENNVGKLTINSHPQIPKLAKEVAGECKGLPLALITVGRAMAGRINPNEWKHALAQLREYQHKPLPGMEKMYDQLAFSYDRLYNRTSQLCFLYCCLFPEDYLISTNDLIELWIGEGLLGDTDDVYDMRCEGEYVLGTLKLACLLESGLNVERQQCVKMHDVIRDMAIWIARDEGKNVRVIENEKDMSPSVISKRGEAKKMSLWGKLIENIPESLPVCSQLETLFVRETNVTLVPRGFFDSTCLTVLDMSHNRQIRLFPKEICNLICLQYLNLSNTSICELPREIKNLTRLRWLLLNETSEHFLIPAGAIASLPLNVFSQCLPVENIYDLGITSTTWVIVPRQLNEKEIIAELERMQHLTELSIIVSKTSSALKIFQSPNLQRSIKKARIKGCQDLTGIVISHSPTVSGVFLHLEELYLENCPVLREIEVAQKIGRAPLCFCFPSLVDVSVNNCGLLDLSLLVHAPKLLRLRLFNCYSLEKIIGDGYVGEELATSGLFSCLRILIIINLPSLTSIYNQTLPFPHLKRLDILGCPRLKKLPLDLNSARGSLKLLRLDSHLRDNLE